ncbi:hypothetical protein MRX96_042580 [Rhipicephalus microplus]
MSVDAAVEFQPLPGRSHNGRGGGQARLTEVGPCDGTRTQCWTAALANISTVGVEETETTVVCFTGPKGGRGGGTPIFGDPGVSQKKPAVQASGPSCAEGR